MYEVRRISSRERSGTNTDQAIKEAARDLRPEKSRGRNDDHGRSR